MVLLNPLYHINVGGFAFRLLRELAGDGDTGLNIGFYLDEGTNRTKIKKDKDQRLRIEKRTEKN